MLPQSTTTPTTAHSPLTLPSRKYPGEIPRVRSYLSRLPESRCKTRQVFGVGMGALMFPRSPDKYIRFGGPSRGISFFQNPGAIAASSSKTSQDRLLSSHEGLHLAPITAMACSEDGSLLFSGAADGTCRLWAVINISRGSGQVSSSILICCDVCSWRVSFWGMGKGGRVGKG